jgi:cGMP-dependent protein kinase
MGSGASHNSTKVMSGDRHLRDLLLQKTSEIQRLRSDNERLKKLVADQEENIHRKDVLNQTLTQEIETLRKDADVQSRTLRELKEILQTHVKPAGPVQVRHRAGISAEPLGHGNKLELTKLPRFKKELRYKDLIMKAIADNDFMRNLEPVQCNEIVECMYEREFRREQYVIREGGVGTQLYVISEGEVQVTIRGEHRGTMGPGKLFGELALLYNCTRTATVKALTETKVWTLDRASFQAIMMNTGIVRQSQHVKFLRSVPEFKCLDKKEIFKIADVLQEDYYSKGEYILRQGSTGDTFFIINAGTVRVTHVSSPEAPETTIRDLHTGAFFGEKALLGDSIRTANVIATTNVSCLTLDKEHFDQLIGDLVARKQWSKEVKEKPKVIDVGSGEDKTYVSLTLSELQRVGTLGMGGFGRVELSLYQHQRRLEPIT